MLSQRMLRSRHLNFLPRPVAVHMLKLIYSFKVPMLKSSDAFWNGKLSLKSQLGDMT
jgi:hypothetical protein